MPPEEDVLTFLAGQFQGQMRRHRAVGACADKDAEGIFFQELSDLTGIFISVSGRNVHSEWVGSAKNTIQIGIPSFRKENLSGQRSGR